MLRVSRAVQRPLLYVYHLSSLLRNISFCSSILLLLLFSCSEVQASSLNPRTSSILRQLSRQLFYFRYTPPDEYYLLFLCREFPRKLYFRGLDLESKPRLHQIVWAERIQDSKNNFLCWPWLSKRAKLSFIRYVKSRGNLKCQSNIARNFANGCGAKWENVKWLDQTRKRRIASSIGITPGSGLNEMRSLGSKLLSNYFVLYSLIIIITSAFVKINFFIIIISADYRLLCNSSTRCRTGSDGPTYLKK